VLVLEDSIEHEKLLATGVDVRRERRAGRVAHDRGCDRFLAAHAVQQAPLDAGSRALHPGLAAGMDKRGNR
jgi:hypothetical protein